VKINGTDAGRANSPSASSAPPKHSVAPAITAFTFGSGDIEGFEVTRGAIKMRELAPAGLGELPAPVQPDDEEQRGLQEVGDGIEPGQQGRSFMGVGGWG